MNAFGEETWRSISVRAASESDLLVLPPLHLAAFPGYFLSRLQTGFLVEYYRAVLEYPQGILIVAGSGPVLLGLAGGFVEPGRFARFLTKRAARLVVPVLLALVRDPTLAPSLLRRVVGVVRSSNDSQCDRVREAELASLAVHPRWQGKGVGEMLVNAFCDRAGMMGASSVRLTTDAATNEAANRLYTKLGFRCCGQEVRSNGRVMNVYVKKLS